MGTRRAVSSPENQANRADSREDEGLKGFLKCFGFLSFLRLFVEAPDGVEEGVAVHDVGVGLGAALGVHRACDVAELS